MTRNVFMQAIKKIIMLGNKSAIGEKAVVRKDISLFKESNIAVKELDALILAEYPKISQTLMKKKSNKIILYFEIQDMIRNLSSELSIDYMPYKCIFIEMKNIIRILNEYPDLISDFLLMKMRRMKELYQNPINDIEREYALANARFIKAVVEKNSAAIKLCALGKYYIDVFGAPQPKILYGRIIRFKVSENLLTESDFQNHMEAIERAAYRLEIVERRLLTKEERASGLHGNRKYFYPRGDDIKEFLQKRIAYKTEPKKKREPLNYDLNAS